MKKVAKVTNIEDARRKRAAKTPRLANPPSPRDRSGGHGSCPGCGLRFPTFEVIATGGSGAIKAHGFTVHVECACGKTWDLVVGCRNPPRG